MRFFWSVLYNIIVIPLLQALSFLAAFVSTKAKQRYDGERETWRILAVLPKHQHRLWFHAASLGEFEQLIPIIERVKHLEPRASIVVSFFSPSGYEPRRSYALADAVVYLPLDSKRNAQRFAVLVQPTVAVVARYDVWHNILEAVRTQGCTTLLVSATLNEESLLLFRTRVGRAYIRHVYSLFTTIYTAGEGETVKFQRLSGELPDIKISTVITAADTRFDRIAEQVHIGRERLSEILPSGLFAEEDFVLVVGSSWQADEDVLLAGINRLEAELRNRLRVVLVPHEPTAAAVRRLMAILPNSEILSDVQTEMGKRTTPPPRHIIVNSIGKLLRIYGVADAAYIGGGFGSGVHSVTEAAGYGLPLACAPGIERARDAGMLLAEGALTLIRTHEDATSWLRTMLESPKTRAEQAAIAYRYVHNRLGWSDVIAAQAAKELANDTNT
jgi:3-deoxy-D-manno-octulosonic-acid transferase